MPQFASSFDFVRSFSSRLSFGGCRDPPIRSPYPHAYPPTSLPPCSYRICPPHARARPDPTLIPTQLRCHAACYVVRDASPVLEAPPSVLPRLCGSVRRICLRCGCLRYRRILISLFFGFLDIGLPKQWSHPFHVLVADLSPCRWFLSSVLYDLISSVPFASLFFRGTVLRFNCAEQPLVLLYCTA